jgi:hypothetical protein
LALGKELFSFFDVAVALEGTKGLYLLAVKEAKSRFFPSGTGSTKRFHGDRVLGFYLSKGSDSR